MSPKRTPLYEEHIKLGAKMVPFAGWEMPLSYTGVIDEHRATRTAAGLFDVSHMGRIEVAGPAAADLLQRIATSDVRRLAPEGMQYALVCNEQGGILDDVMICRFGGGEYLVCANASNAGKILDWIRLQAAGTPGATVADRSAELAQLAVQGPRGIELMSRLADAAILRLRPRQCAEVQVAGVSMRLSRSGYTGEPGFELYPPVGSAAGIWQALLESGGAAGLKPCGLGCRDTLRLEMGYPLYGNDMDESTTPIEAGLDFGMDWQNTEFIGRAALARQKQEGAARRLVGFELRARGVPRHGCRVLSDGKEIGQVASGNHSPSLNKGIGLAFVQTPFARPGTEIRIDIRGEATPAVVVEKPFYKRERR